MNDTSLHRLETTAEAYERLLVPTLFESWTRRMCDAADIRAGQRVLDVACGTGILARTAARRVQPDGAVAGLDVNAEMLAVARRIAPGIDWRQGQAESLPYPEGAFDAVVSQFGLMFFSDRAAALGEMMRVLVPGGRLAVAVFDSLNEIPAYAAMASVLAGVVGAAAADALRFPFVLGDTRELMALFPRAGIDSASVTTHHETVTFRCVEDMVLADVEGWFPLAGIHVDQPTLQALIREARTALQPHVLPDGAVKFRAAAHIVTATRG